MIVVSAVVVREVGDGVGVQCCLFVCWYVEVVGVVGNIYIYI